MLQRSRGEIGPQASTLASIAPEKKAAPSLALPFKCISNIDKNARCYSGRHLLLTSIGWTLHVRRPWGL